jgi:aerobic-type carbon monoxide dehydrogenase small subunit (CoxS/CutS family)
MRKGTCIVSHAKIAKKPKLKFKHLALSIQQSVRAKSGKISKKCGIGGACTILPEKVSARACAILVVLIH